MMLYADAARFARDRGRGRVLRDLLWPYRELDGTLGDAICLGSAWLGVAAASDAAADTGRAMSEYEVAAERNDASGQALWATIARARQAELAFRAELDDADALIKRSLADAKTLGVAPLVATLEKLQPDCPLSRREQEIVVEVAVGRSNREIAERLFISVKTVERHLANVFNKLGVASRTEAAMWARDAGLTRASA